MQSYWTKPGLKYLKLRMLDPIVEIFKDDRLVEKIKRLLPLLFQLAEFESSRAGKVGMEVGSVRERIIIALLIYKFGEENVETNIPITEPEVDVKVYGIPISIKTISGSKVRGVKLIWTVDAIKSKEFLKNYFPKSNILLVHVRWGRCGGFYYIPLEVQRHVFELLGREKYIKLPKEGTNPRGVEISDEALHWMVQDSRTKHLDILWKRIEINYNPYKRWVDLWKEDEYEEYKEWYKNK